MNLPRIFAQTDLFERATILFVVFALIALPAIGKWLTEHDDDGSDRRIAMFLAGLTAIGTIVVLVAAVLGPHPA